MAKKKPTATSEYVQDPLEYLPEDVQEEFSELVLAKIQNKTAQDEAKEALDAINPRLAYLMITHGVEKFEHGDLKFYVLRSENVTISQDLLLKNGVKADVIEKSKVRKPYTTVTVTTKKG